MLTWASSSISLNLNIKARAGAAQASQHAARTPLSLAPRHWDYRRTPTPAWLSYEF